MDYKILPVSLANLVALILPWLEFIPEYFLLVGRADRRKYSHHQRINHNVFVRHGIRFGKRH
jgi:hypothetical protein